jgi:hypothetical protein
MKKTSRRTIQQLGNGTMAVLPPLSDVTLVCGGVTVLIPQKQFQKIIGTMGYQRIPGWTGKTLGATGTRAARATGAHPRRPGAPRNQRAAQHAT